ncbi:inositol monophosphatase family protein [Comamonas guangdongensis]|uniref:Inositol monophosphatase n=1 Tax=Comamonas guangdongensis TaxID=510515 RepID=A0ABV3ZZF6_9BURK
MTRFPLVQVAALLHSAAEELIAPRWRRLEADDIQLKAPGEWVTAVDREVEERLSIGLKALLPGSAVVGEEQCALRPQLLGSIGAGLVWLLDPVDGTGNLVAGSGPVSVMLALLEDGETLASWMLNPLTGVMHHAQKGGGAWRGSQRIVARRASPPGGPGIVRTRFLPEEFKKHLAQTALEFRAGSNCAGEDYPSLLADNEFALYWRVLPWDHAPGALFVSEAGGVAAHLDGRAYRAGQQQPGLLVARSQQTWDRARALFPPLER